MSWLVSPDDIFHDEARDGCRERSLSTVRIESLLLRWIMVWARSFADSLSQFMDSSPELRPRPIEVGSGNVRVAEFQHASCTVLSPWRVSRSSDAQGRGPARRRP